MSIPVISLITLYPIKSLDGVTVEETTVLPTGRLAHDREYALVDGAGRFVNGKRYAQVHLLRVQHDLANGVAILKRPDEATPRRFHLEADRPALEKWLSKFFGFPVRIIRNAEKGYPDDADAFGPTLISTGTLAEVSQWFPPLGVEQMRLRFRANLEIDEATAFWEDQLFGEPGAVVEFTVGPVKFEGANPCQRCVVPSRDPTTAEVYPDFQRVFMKRRQAALPSWAAASRFNHFYRLSVNTRIAVSEAGKIIRVGDPIRVIGERRVG